MIPPLILVGLLVGRPWIVPLTAAAWAAFLLAGDFIAVAGVPLALAIAGANAATGVLVRVAIVKVLRRLRHTTPLAAQQT